jgi:hypothetical protein
MRSYLAGLMCGRSYFPRLKHDALARSLNICIGIPRARQKRRSRIARRSCATSREPPSGARWRRAARFGCPPHAHGSRRSWPPNSSCRSASSRPCPSWTPPSARRASCRVATSTATPRQGLARRAPSDRLIPRRFFRDRCATVSQRRRRAAPSASPRTAAGATGVSGEYLAGDSPTARRTRPGGAAS